MNEAVTQLVKYVFLDVVRFTVSRSVEAQTEIVARLNECVARGMASCELSKKDVILIPTGDGLCIAILPVGSAYDIHLTLAREILVALDNYNAAVQDESRRFEIRLGINENVDNLVTDINGMPNVAGAGISTAQRINNAADGNQILVSAMVYETLRHRERYMQSFRRFDAIVKHKVALPVFQFIDDQQVGLSTTVPSQFAEEPQPEKHLTELEAYYLAHAIRNKDWLIKDKARAQATYAAAVTLFYLAEDSVSILHAREYEDPIIKLRGKNPQRVQEAYDYYKSIDFWVCCDLASSFVERLRGIRGLIEGYGLDVSQFHVVTDDGREKLKREFPQIWTELELDKY
jgi:class 3 adenylate cyclase